MANISTYVGSGGGAEGAAGGGGEIITCAGSVYCLTAANQRAVALCFSSDPTQAIACLPNATTLAEGSPTYSISNVNSQTTIALKDACGCLLSVIPPYGAMNVGLYNNTCVRGGWVLDNAQDIASFNVKSTQCVWCDTNNDFESQKYFFQDSYRNGYTSMFFVTYCEANCCYKAFRVKECSDGSICVSGGVNGQFATCNGFIASRAGNGFVFTICKDYGADVSGTPACICCDRMWPYTVINCDATCALDFVTTDGNGASPTCTCMNSAPTSNRWTNGNMWHYVHPLTDDYGMWYTAYKTGANCLYESFFCLNTETTGIPVCCNKFTCIHTQPFGGDCSWDRICLSMSMQIDGQCSPRSRHCYPAFIFTQTLRSTCYQNTDKSMILMTHFNNYNSGNVCRYKIKYACCMSSSCLANRICAASDGNYVIGNTKWYNDQPIIRLYKYTQNVCYSYFVPNKDCTACDTGEFFNGGVTNGRELTFWGKHHAAVFNASNFEDGCQFTRICCLCPNNMNLVNLGCLRNPRSSGTSIAWGSMNTTSCSFWACPAGQIGWGASSGCSLDQFIDFSTVGREDCCVLYKRGHKLSSDLDTHQTYNVARNCGFGSFGSTWKELFLLECDTNTCWIGWMPFDDNGQGFVNGNSAIWRRFCANSNCFGFDYCMVVCAPSGCACCTDWTYLCNNYHWCFNPSTRRVCLTSLGGQSFNWCLCSANGTTTATECEWETFSLGTDRARHAYNLSSDGNKFLQVEHSQSASSGTTPRFSYFDMSSYPPSVCRFTYDEPANVTGYHRYDPHNCVFMSTFSTCVCSSAIVVDNYSYRATINPTTGLPTQQDFGVSKAGGGQPIFILPFSNSVINCCKIVTFDTVSRG
jgi:hypothetical protein